MSETTSHEAHDELAFERRTQVQAVTYGSRARVCVLATRARRLIRRGAPARLAIAAVEALVGPFDGVAERAEGWLGRLVEDAPAGAQRLRRARELTQCHPVAWPAAAFRFSEAL